MKNGFALPGLSFSLVLGVMAQDGVPSVTITNGQVRAKLYLPDAQRGYCRGVRFDWSGVIASLEYRGHNYFGQWFPRYDPKLHDSITGPVRSSAPAPPRWGTRRRRPAGLS